MRTHFFKVKPLSDESLMYSTMLLSPVSRLLSWGLKASTFSTFKLKIQIYVNFDEASKCTKPQIMITMITL